MGKELSLTEQLCYNTTRIESIRNDGSVVYGTGFFVGAEREDDTTSLLLVTNRHVIKDSKELRFCLTIKDGKGNPIDTDKMEVIIDEPIPRSVSHPNKDVDLSVVFVTKAIVDLSLQLGKEPYYKHFPLSMIATREQMNKLDAMEDVIMVGYPVGLWDSVNNRPIFRRGITATDPKVDFEGKKEFLIDCACIWGSSGSPVIRNEHTIDSNSIQLIGIQYAMPTHKISGRLEVVDTDSNKIVIPTSDIPINIGYIIKAECIFDILREVEKRYPLKFKYPM